MTTAPPGILPVIAIDRTSRKPLYRQLYEGYREAIVERRLRAGQRLPSTRSLAVELGVSRIPVLNAFEQLLAEGYFESRVGSGTFVARSLPDELLSPARRSISKKPPARLSSDVIRNFSSTPFSCFLTPVPQLFTVPLVVISDLLRVAIVHYHFPREPRTARRSDHFVVWVAFLLGSTCLGRQFG